MNIPALGGVLTGFFVVAMLVTEASGLSRTVYGTFKTLAALTFVVAGALTADLSSLTGQAFLFALVMSAVGDICLIPKGAKAIFVVGIAAFLLAHVGFVVTFLSLGVRWSAVALAAAVALTPSLWLLVRYIWPKLNGFLKPAVVVYVLALPVMLAFAAGAASGGAEPLLLIAAVVFYCSDLFVARQRFIRPGMVNRVLGIPLYFCAQMLFVAALAAR